MNIEVSKDAVVGGAIGLVGGGVLGALIALAIAGGDTGQAVVTNYPEDGSNRVAVQAEENQGDSVSSSEVGSGGVTAEVSDVSRSGSVELSNGKTVEAPDGGEFVSVSTTVQNDSKRGLDLTCYSSGDYLNTELVDGEGRQFDPASNVDGWEISGNPECNVDLLPGFDHDVVWVYVIPEGTDVVAWQYKLETGFVVEKVLGPTVRVPIDA